MNSRAGYRLNAFAVWRKAVIQIFLEINFPSGGTAQSAACDGWEQSQESQLRAEEEREKTLRKALELLGDQSRFKDEIIKKPATAEEATHLLDDEQTAVAGNGKAFSNLFQRFSASLATPSRLGRYAV